MYLRSSLFLNKYCYDSSSMLLCYILIKPLQVARCTKIINEGTPDAMYMISVKQIAKFAVALGEKVAPTDIEESMRVGVDRSKYQIQIPLPPRIDPSVTMMQVEEKPDVTYDDVGGAEEAIEKLREVVELPLLHPERFLTLCIDPPKGVLLYGPPGTGKTLSARAVANRTDACFIRVIGSELVQKYVGEGARMVRELFEMARSKKACIVFFDEVDAIGGTRGGGDGSENEVQRTMLQIVTELDGFDARGNIKVLMATNRPDTLDPALLRPGRLDRKVEFGLPNLKGRAKILKIHSSKMNCDKGIRFELLARLCPNTTGAELRSVCTEAGMYVARSLILCCFNMIAKIMPILTSKITPVNDAMKCNRTFFNISTHKRGSKCLQFLLFDFLSLCLSSIYLPHVTEH